MALDIQLLHIYQNLWDEGSLWIHWLTMQQIIHLQHVLTSHLAILAYPTDVLSIC